MIDKTMAAPKPGVVDQNPDGAELRTHFFRHSPDLTGVGHVANHGQRPAPRRANLVADAVDLAGGARTDGDVGPGFGQRDGASFADAPTAAGDQRYFAIQSVHLGLGHMPYFIWHMKYGIWHMKYILRHLLPMDFGPISFSNPAR